MLTVRFVRVRFGNQVSTKLHHSVKALGFACFIISSDELLLFFGFGQATDVRVHVVNNRVPLAVRGLFWGVALRRLDYYLQRSL
jgi:hypothetical protein